MKLLNDARAAKRILREVVRSGQEDAVADGHRPVHYAITYLTNNLDKMKYASARAQGLHSSDAFAVAARDFMQYGPANVQ